jgi:1-acyl-sn-glycerol-3-phosphate acyltransferase
MQNLGKTFAKAFSWLRSAIFVLFFFPILTVFFSLFGAILFFLTGSRRGIEWSGNNWGALTLKFLNVNLNVKGLENIPQGGCLFLFNHSSFMDIFALAAIVKKIKFGAKVELYKIPFFGLALRTAGMLPIARSHREKAIKVLSEAESRARNGEKFALAPEGTRNNSQEVLLPFKSGPFIFAINSGIPLVPVIIKGADQAWTKHSLIPCSDRWAYEMSVEFLPAISTEGYNMENRRELVEKTRNQMLPKM